MAELDAWRDSKRQLLDAAGSELPAPGTVARRHTRWMVIAGLAVVVVMGAGGVWLASRPEGSQRRVPNPEAVRAVQRATFGANAGRTQIQTAIRYYQDAIRLDPMYAAAWSGLATAHFALTWFGEDPAAETMATARMEAQEALRLDDTSAGALRIMAFVTHYLDWNHASAETYFRRAFELRPGDAVVLSWYGDFLTNVRRFDEAREQYRRAQDASPRWLEPASFAANIHVLMGNPDLAITEHRRLLESEPNFGLGNHFLGRAYLMKGDYARGIEQLHKSNELLGRVPFSLGDLGYGLAVSGDHDAARRLLADLTARRANGYYPAFPFAQIHLGLGDIDSALDWLERAADERHMGFYFPSADPTYEPLWSHSRFRTLMQRLNLPAF